MAWPAHRLLTATQAETPRSVWWQDGRLQGEKLALRVTCLMVTLKDQSRSPRQDVQAQCHRGEAEPDTQLTGASLHPAALNSESKVQGWVWTGSEKGSYRGARALRQGRTTHLPGPSYSMVPALSSSPPGVEVPTDK